MLPLEHSAVLSTFIKPPFVIKISVLSIFEWPFYTGFTVFMYIKSTHPKVSEYDQEIPHSHTAAQATAP